MGEGVHTIGQGVRKTDRSYQRDTDKGLNRQEAFRVNQVESKIRDRKTEKGYLVDSNGNIIGETGKGTSHKASFNKADLVRAKDAILTHNHPTEGANSGLYGTLAGRIGVPFSGQDIKVAAQFDLKEVRAVTPTYTYSIRRPKGGWGDSEKINAAIDRYTMNSGIGARLYASRQGLSPFSNIPRQRAKEVADRANVGTQYSLLKKLAKEFGWEFTRRKVK